MKEIIKLRTIYILMQLNFLCKHYFMITRQTVDNLLNNKGWKKTFFKKLFQRRESQP